MEWKTVVEVMEMMTVTSGTMVVGGENGKCDQNEKTTRNPQMGPLCPSLLSNQHKTANVRQRDYYFEF